MHLNPGVEGLLMPPDCIKSGVLDDDEAAPTCAKIRTESWPSQAHSRFTTIPACIRCGDRSFYPGQWPRCVGLTPSLVAAIWLHVACVADPARRQRLKAKWEAGECVREHIAVSCCLLLLASQGMLKARKKFTRDTLTNWAFGKDTVYVVWIVFHAKAKILKKDTAPTKQKTNKRCPPPCRCPGNAGPSKTDKRIQARIQHHNTQEPRTASEQQQDNNCCRDTSGSVAA